MEPFTDRRKYKRDQASKPARINPVRLVTKKQEQIAVSHSLDDRRQYKRPLAARLLRMTEVESLCGLSKATIYKGIKAGTFPSPIKIGLRASAWIKPEIEQWIEQRITASRR